MSRATFDSAVIRALVLQEPTGGQFDPRVKDFVRERAGDIEGMIVSAKIAAGKDRATR